MKSRPGSCAVAEGDASHCLHGNPLHDIPFDLALSPVVEPRGARIGVPGEALHVFERHALFEQNR